MQGAVVLRFQVMSLVRVYGPCSLNGSNCYFDFTKYMCIILNCFRELCDLFITTYVNSGFIQH